jgi:hypothetical protein
MRVRSLSILDVQNICRYCDNQVMVARLTSSSQVKQCPNRCFSKVEQAKVAGCQIRIVWIWSKGFQLTYCGRFWNRCAVCGWALSARRNAPSLRRPGRLQCRQEMYDSLDFQTRSVSQAGHHVALRQPYFSCASRCMSMRTRPLFCVYQPQLKLQRSRNL